MPAPHNIMTGLWEPSPADAAKGVPEGFGAITKLLKPEACGKGSTGPLGQVWRDAWMFASAEFALTQVPVGSAKEDATTAADKADCRGSDQSAFPGGAWATLPTYLTPSYTLAGGSVVRGVKSYRCWGTQTANISYPISKRGIYAACAYANKGTAAEAAAQRKIYTDLIAASLTARTAAGVAHITDMAC